jgi:hypothetical protein
MKEFFKDIAGDKTIILASFVNMLFLFLTTGFILFSYGKLPPLIPIFNQLPWGEQRLGPTITVFIPDLIAFLIFVINMLMSAFVYKKIPLISRMFAAVSLLMGVLTFIFVVRIIMSII